jgi:hypothetical protein
VLFFLCHIVLDIIKNYYTVFTFSGLYIEQSTMVFRMYTKITEVTTADVDLKHNQYFQGNDVNIQRNLKTLQNS